MPLMSFIIIFRLAPFQCIDSEWPVQCKFGDIFHAEIVIVK